MFGQAAFTEYATRLIPQAPVELNHDLLDFTGESPWNRTKLCQVKSLMPRAGRPTTQNCGGELAGSVVFDATPVSSNTVTTLSSIEFIQTLNWVHLPSVPYRPTY